jgi:hypothetical protein
VKLFVVHYVLSVVSCPSVAGSAVLYALTADDARQVVYLRHSNVTVTRVDVVAQCL